MPPSMGASLMHYVYLIESVYNRSQHYVGQTGDLRVRI
jgi:predicted GIY-YIG superfamily endonuclease